MKSRLGVIWRNKRLRGGSSRTRRRRWWRRRRRMGVEVGV
jgi:hypothetical protein